MWIINIPNTKWSPEDGSGTQISSEGKEGTIPNVDFLERTLERSTNLEEMEKENQLPGFRVKPVRRGTMQNQPNSLPSWVTSVFWSLRTASDISPLRSRKASQGSKHAHWGVKKTETRTFFPREKMAQWWDSRRDWDSGLVFWDLWAEWLERLFFPHTVVFHLISKKKNKPRSLNWCHFCFCYWKILETIQNLKKKMD